LSIISIIAKAARPPSTAFPRGLLKISSTPLLRWLWPLSLLLHIVAATNQSAEKIVAGISVPDVPGARLGLRLRRPAADYAAEESGEHTVQLQTTRRRSFTVLRTTRLAGARQESEVVAGRRNLDFKESTAGCPSGAQSRSTRRTRRTIASFADLTRV
jgi:hypothetical protein